MSIENGMSRRNFLSGAAVAGAAIAGMAGLSACSPAASSSKSDAKADTKAAATGETTMGFDGTGAMPWLGEKPEIADADVEETVDVDVVVVGLGAAGVPATRAAAEAGAKVVALESSPKLNSVASDMAIFGGETQASGAAATASFDKKMVVNMHMEECSHHVNQSIISTYYDKSGEALDWFVAGSRIFTSLLESYAEIPEASQKNYMFPYMYPVPETYDYKGRFALLPHIGRLQQPGNRHAGQFAVRHRRGRRCALRDQGHRTYSGRRRHRDRCFRSEDWF